MTAKAKIWMAGASMATVLSLSGLVSAPQAFANLLYATSFSINTSVLYNAQIDVPYSEQLEAGTVTHLMLGPNTTRVHRAMAASPTVATSNKWVITQGSLPAGLTLSDSGLVSGTPAGPDGTSSVTVQVTDANGQTASRTFSITVFGVHILKITTTDTDLPVAREFSSYHGKLSAVGGQGLYMWKVVQGIFPPGVTLASDGTLSGTPKAGGTYVATVQVFDALGNSAAQTYYTNVKWPSSSSYR